MLEEQAKLRHASLKGQRRRLLVDSDEELEVLAEIEGLTSARLLAERGRNPHLDPRELAWRRRQPDGQPCRSRASAGGLPIRFPRSVD